MGRAGYKDIESDDDTPDNGSPESAARAAEPDRDASGVNRLTGLRGLHREIKNTIEALKSGQSDNKPDECFRSVGDSPNGNPRLAAFMATDPSFMIVRQFRYLQARVLLDMQEDLRRHESELDILDRQKLSNKDGGDDVSAQQRELLKKVSACLTQYANVISSIKQFDQYEEPTNSRLRNLISFFKFNTPFGNDKSYYQYRNDLIVLRDVKGDAFIDRNFIHPLLEQPGRLLQKLFRDPAYLDSDEHLRINNSRRVLIFKALIALSILLLILVGPIYPLYYLSQIQPRSAMLLSTASTQFAFATIFAIFVTLFTTAKRHEIFTIVTAYIGLLVVFMSQTLGPSQSGS
ncbi:hypothetical protein F4803DRAFT_503936 [Xylaria telfairii]|nr:hypothetical protein F4803DRAFT_503936 [Xylaria telfairii]